MSRLYKKALSNLAGRIVSLTVRTAHTISAFSILHLLSFSPPQFAAQHLKEGAVLRLDQRDRTV
jgi:hypothetical protein